MPIPSRKSGEDKRNFMSRCMSDPKMKKEYPDQRQRGAVCDSRASLVSWADDIYYEETYGYTEELTQSNFEIPEEKDYIDIEEEATAVYVYKNPKTSELYFFERQGIYKKDGTTLILIKGAEYQGRKVKLNKPFRTPKGPKKFAVYTKNEKGKVVIVRFGDPNMSIKKNNPERRKSFRARHNCKNPGPKWKARYWSCRAW